MLLYPKEWHRLTLRLASVVLGLLLLLVGYGAQITIASNPPAATLLPPTIIAAYRASVDERDIDTYPALAYDAASGRYLSVWLSLRHATASNAGLTVYGRFLDRNGMALSQQFPISDMDNAARSNAPTVAAGADGFVVAWTVRGAQCQLAVQQVTDASDQPDQILPLTGETHHHSPQLVYQAARQRYVVTYIAGDDYLPPLLWGTDITDVADCGNNAESSSEVRASEFHFANGLPTVDAMVTVSTEQGGAFRPAIAYSAGLDQYAVAWEDRRNANSDTYAFDVYAQQLNADLSLAASNLQLATANYQNLDNSATWTPRPTLAASETGFLTTWFERTVSGSATIWSVQSRLLVPASPPGDKFPVMRMTFAQPHTGDAPTGFLASTYMNTLQEFLVTASSHQESLAGYFSAARIQRITATGQLLQLDGSTRLTPGLGNRIDPANDIQFAMAVAADSNSGANHYLVAYSKHAPDGHSQDFDIWGAPIHFPTSQVTPTPPPTATATATITATVTATVTVLPTHTPTLLPTDMPTATSTSSATPQATGTPYPIYMPIIRR